jgi:hypothetical protein
MEVLEAVQELFPRFAEARNVALKRQYAIALGNILGTPGEFYRFITGEASSRQARCRTLFASFKIRVEPILEETGGAMDDCGRAIEAERGRDALDSCLRIHGIAMSRLFGGFAKSPDFHEAAGRADMRLGAWCWIASEATRRVALLGSLDDATCMIVALLGMYYLGSGIY